MSAKRITDLSQLCVHTITTKPWSIEEAATQFSAAGVKGITVWRDAIDGRNTKLIGQMLRAHNLTIVSLCRGGFFPNRDSAKRKAAINDNKKAIDEAAELGTNMLVLVCGADAADVSGVPELASPAGILGHAGSERGDHGGLLRTLRSAGQAIRN